ncbi:MAG: hypothetical protein NT133_02450 [Alphaproteobacteria bacterium]|nr:hypothetical protein [Alphaproteobacteria bacterium]
MSNAHLISNPNSKLARLCVKAGDAGGKLTTFAALAKVLDVTPGAISQIFGAGKESAGAVPPKDMLGNIVAAFKADGLHVELEWFYLEFDAFADRLAGKVAARAPAAWEKREESIAAELVEFRLHDPTETNREGGMNIPATLYFGSVEFDEEGFAIGVKDATITPLPGGFVAAEKSFIGERAPHDNFTRVAGGVRVIKPQNRGGALEGSPLGEEHLFAVERAPEGTEEITIEITAGRRSFVVTPLPDPNATQPDTTKTGAAEKDAVLNVFLKKALAPNAPRPVIARARLKRGGNV